MVSLTVTLFSTKCFLFVYMYIDLFKLKAYKLFENSDGDLNLSSILLRSLSYSTSILNHLSLHVVTNQIRKGDKPCRETKEIRFLNNIFLKHLF